MESNGAARPAKRERPSLIDGPPGVQRGCGTGGTLSAKMRRGWNPRVAASHAHHVRVLGTPPSLALFALRSLTLHAAGLAWRSSGLFRASCRHLSGESTCHPLTASLE